MCAITLTKARRAARDQNRQKRGQNREQYLDAAASETKGGFELAGSEDNPIDAAEVADQLQSVLAGLGEQEQLVLDLKLQQFNNDEIAEKIGCSERTVRRLSKKIQRRWNELIDQDE